MTPNTILRFLAGYFSVIFGHPEVKPTRVVDEVGRYTAVSECEVGPNSTPSLPASPGADLEFKDKEWLRSRPLRCANSGQDVL